MAAKIVIKIKDAFFLQEITYTNPVNAGKLVIGSNFPFQNSANDLSSQNFGELAGVYPTMKGIGNQGESIMVFKNLIDNISPLASNGKIESLFSVTDATYSVNLSRMSRDGAGYIGENLLNFYFIEVNSSEVESKLNDINKLKENNLLRGIDYFYVRDELADFKQVSNVSTHSFGPDTSSSLPHKDFGSMINAEAFIPNVLIGDFPKIEGSLAKGFIQHEPVLQNLMSDSPKMERILLNKAITEEPDAQHFGKNSNDLSPSISTKTTIPIIIDNINKLFAKCGIVNDADLQNIRVIDMEQGWNLTDPELSNLIPTLINNSLLSTNVLGGGCNYDSSPPKKDHGTNTLNVLFKKTGNVNTLSGLCMNAQKGVASAWFRDLLLSDEKKEAALNALLGNQYINPVTGNTIGPRTSPIDIGDVILLELQTNVIGKRNLPVEITPAMFDIIAKGVSAGFIIIEAAGNGPSDGLGLNGNNLNLSHLWGYKNLRTENTKAIMVGAIKGNPNNSSAIRSCNYGKRIDCYCYADDVFTKYIDDTSTSNLIFNSSSMASAVVAALVANLQSYAKKNIIKRSMTITEIKNYLNSTTYNGPFANSKKPNLAISSKFIDYLNILPRTRPTLSPSLRPDLLP